jgi:hypothetical protein
MNFDMFMDRLTDVLPPGKSLTAVQWSAYRSKLGQFNEDQLSKLHEAILENCKFFPKIADVFDQAKFLGFTERKTEYRPHTWTPTNCDLCGGSGMVAAFWSQEFEITGEEKRQILRLHYVFPYHESGEYQRRKDHDDVRAAYRCSCPCGEISTLARGIPRWRTDMPQVMRKDWAA